MTYRERFRLLASNCARAFMTDSEKEHAEEFEKLQKEYYDRERFSWGEDTYKYDEGLVVYGNIPRIWTLVNVRNEKKKLLCVGLDENTAYVTKVTGRQVLKYKNLPWGQLTIKKVKKHGWIVVVGSDNSVHVKVRVKIK